MKTEMTWTAFTGRAILTGCLALIYFFPLRGQIVNIENERIRTDTTGWNGQLEGSLDLSKNSTFLLSANTKAHIQRKWKKDLLLLLGDWHFVSGDNKKFMNDGMAHFRFNHKFGKRISIEAFSQVQYNKLMNVNLRILEGMGPRLKLSMKDNYKMYWGLLYMFEYEEVSAPDTLHLDHRISTYLTFNFHPGKNFSIAGTNYYQPLIKNFRDYRLSGTYYLRFDLAKKLQFKLDFNYQYDSNPPDQIPNFVYNLRPGLIFRFRE